MVSSLFTRYECHLTCRQEASLVDITYLLESGALVDFSSDELVHLLLALFTDTPNRTELISKIMSRSQA
jgi:centromere/kinetochore protein ZW10